jgi:hypothetical protein
MPEQIFAELFGSLDLSQILNRVVLKFGPDGPKERYECALVNSLIVSMGVVKYQHFTMRGD